MSIFSMDPGVKHCGCAIWTEDGHLEDAWLAQNPGGDWWNMARHIRDSLEPCLKGVTLGVIEQMQVYRRGGAPAKDLLRVQSVVGGVATALDCDIKLYLPKEWKGTAPKERTIQRIQDALHEEELELITLPRAKSLAHNVWDGIGVGLHYFAEKGIRTW